MRPSRIRREPVRPSRIRRDPVKHEKEVQVASEEREIWGGIAGVLLIALTIAAAIAGISAATYFRDSDAEPAGHFGQCYNENAPNCVLDGGTAYIAGDKVKIAGIAAPAIEGAKCEEERSRGIDAAVHLADLLSSGAVTTVASPSRGPDGSDVRTVQVKGQDVGEAMIAAGVVRRDDGTTEDWCTPTE